MSLQLRELGRVCQCQLLVWHLPLQPRTSFLLSHDEHEHQERLLFEGTSDARGKIQSRNEFAYFDIVQVVSIVVLPFLEDIPHKSGSWWPLLSEAESVSVNGREHYQECIARLSCHICWTSFLIVVLICTVYTIVVIGQVSSLLYVLICTVFILL